MSLSGKIYKIIHSRSNFVYVGSTFNTLNKRRNVNAENKYLKLTGLNI